VAEELIFGDVSSGAANDLERASEIARSMITRLGMSKKLGPLTYGRHHQLQFLGGEDHEERNYSEETARIIDEECRKLVEEGHARARNILTENRAALDALAATLEEKEVLDGEVVKEIIAKHPAGK
ncbi:MAG TPA: cell division protein FtsH, partial [Desulfobacteraceae bacterium]|nr:cell division protein FtsH [Desulfobacteraceae bacterium]